MTVSAPCVLLVILDGWGWAKPGPYNAITTAQTPNWDYLWSHCLHTLLEGSGTALGLPSGQMGNSEVGHLTLGSGRTVYQDLTRIDQAIKTREFFSNETLLSLKPIQRERGCVHLLGLLSSGGVHSHERHLYALLELMVQQKIEKVYLHLFLDGRDTPPKSAISSLLALEAFCAAYSSIQVASLVGRYYAMDRDQRWERTHQAYRLITQGEAKYHESTALLGLEAAYSRGESDEFVSPTVIYSSTQPPIILKSGDQLFCWNFRADRMKQLVQPFVDLHFKEFSLTHPPLAVVSLTPYFDASKLPAAFPRSPLTNTLGEVLSTQGLTQLRIAETEKYAHVTYFFNGGREMPFLGEERCLIPSPKVQTYNLKPEMSVLELTQQLITFIKARRQDVIICNIANPDMIGHTGDFEATVRAIEVVDQCLGQMMQAILKAGGEMLITADHGNAECLYDTTTNQSHTAHTCALVPFIYQGRPAVLVPTRGAIPNLSAVAPTLLYLLGLPKPSEMTGNSLIRFV